MAAQMEEYTNSQIRELINEYIHSERDRKILYRRLVDGITFERLAEEFGLSTRQTCQIVKKGTDRLSRHMPGR